MVDHDRLFKELLTTFFLEFIELFFPKVRSYLEPDSLTFLDKEVFTDVTAGAKYETDVLAKIRFADSDSYFLIHLENQSYSQADFEKRMFRYFARLHEKFELPIYPIVVFSFDRPKEPQDSSYSVTFEDLEVLKFNYRVVQLNQLKWQDFTESSNVVASALMAKMSIKAEERPVVKVQCLRSLASLQLNPALTQLVSGFIDQYLPLDTAEEQIFQQQIDKIEADRRESVMKIVTSWMEKGLEQGREEGIQQGTEKVVLRLLQRKIGTLEKSVEEKVRALSIAQLENLSVAILDFNNKADLIAWLETKDNKASSN
ncbi:MAG: DUF4351 domain-containing protein [Prochloraceae cyanobacterium]|nr:DUF4351 domain-containing protein [Prochloraceae cyanobacterium]